MKKIVLAMMLVLVVLACEQLFTALKIRDLQTGCQPNFGVGLDMGRDFGSQDLGKRD